MEYLIKEFKVSPDYTRFYSVLDYCNEEQRKTVYAELMGYLENAKRWGRHSNLLAKIYYDEKDYEKIMSMVLDREIDPGEFEKMLVHQYPEEMISYFHELIQGCINRQNRSSYQEGAKYAFKIKNIYTKVLKIPADWEKYIARILQSYPRHKALQEEFKKCL